MSPSPQAGASAVRLAVIDTDSGFLQVLTRRLDARGWRHRVVGGAIPAEEVLLSLHGPQQESWTWNEGHRDQVVALARLVPLEE